MIRPRKARLLLTIAVAGVLSAGSGAAERRGITEKDLFSFVWVADPQIAPDGSQVAFVRVTADDKKDTYQSSIWIARSDARRRHAGRPRYRGVGTATVVMTRASAALRARAGGLRVPVGGRACPRCS